MSPSKAQEVAAKFPTMQSPFITILGLNHSCYFLNSWSLSLIIWILSLIYRLMKFSIYCCDRIFFWKAERNVNYPIVIVVISGIDRDIIPKLTSNNYSIGKNDSLCVLTVSCVPLLETCKLGLRESCIIIASHYVIFPWNCVIFTYSGTEGDTMEGPLVTHLWDLAFGCSIG